jgi:threonyl-tRNA synthetase
MSEEEQVDLETMRHSASHVMAAAVKRLYPGVKFAFGPAIEDGFYYDFDLPEPLKEEELGRIEDEMVKIVKEGAEFKRKELPKAEVARAMTEEGQDYKLELLGEIEDDRVSVYELGDFVDVCAGPHVSSSGDIGAFKLSHVAGAYWKGDSKNKMLQRVYGTAFATKAELEEHLRRLEEAGKRDHRKLGTTLDLFSFHENAPGFAFWHPKGWTLYNTIMEHWREVHGEAGYAEVNTPLILDRGLWHKSGHWDHYRENMYFVDVEEREFAVKPMNCPGGLLIYKSRQHSYRELPMRMAELGLVHRRELSGVRAGLFRVCAFTQDDAHIFCLPEQAKDEIKGVIELTLEMYRTFGFDDCEVKLSTRPDHSIGSDEMWEAAESALREALDEMKLEYKPAPGEGAFYGPKIDFDLRDCLGRAWQCGTIQCDFAMPERFDLSYVGPDDRHHRPVMIHRAVFGSFERFIGVLIEHYAGALPMWLAPVHVEVISVTEEHVAYAEEVGKRLKEAGLRAELDLRNARVGAKIRDATLRKIPFMLVVGAREAKEGTVAVRERQKGDVGTSKLEEFIEEAKRLVETKVAANS